jgi:integrase
MLYKRGNIWWTKFNSSGKQYRVSCKTNDKTLAKEIELSIKSDIIRKRFEIPGKNKKKLIFLSLWQEYLDNVLNDKNTIENKKFLSKHFLPVFKDNDIRDINVSQIENYCAKRKSEIMALPKNKGKSEKNISFRTVNMEKSILHNFFNYCIKKEYIEKNPASGIKKFNELSRLKTLSDEDILKLINGSPNKLTKDLIAFLILSGCRKGEALNLKWDDVDLQNDVIAIKGTKTKYDRYIPISKPLKDLLGGIEKHQDCLYVFHRNGAKLGDFKRSFHTACKNAGFKDLRIHDLRHVFASKMVMNGTSLFITGELLGHRTTQMTKRYSHLVPETLKKAVDEVWNK